MVGTDLFAIAISSSIDLPVLVQQVSPIAGGCINQAYRITTDQGLFFIKTNSIDVEAMFKTEYKGLKLLSETSTLEIPDPIGFGTFKDHSYLVLSFVEAGSRHGDYWEDFGQRLAALHAIKASAYGLDFDNYIGRLPQKNRWLDNWLDFFVENRIKPQIKMAIDSQRFDVSITKVFEKLRLRLKDWFPDEPPSLLHGDLWSGNVMVGNEGWVCLVDPAVYYGHREMELAFTQLFGGFDPLFYKAYEEAAPLAPKFEQRVDLYNLYPLLVHVNLFGGGYIGSVKQILKRYLD
ncbi:MAG: fructosamine kinase family protein [Cyclobacteriaceae bacterium]